MDHQELQISIRRIQRFADRIADLILVDSVPLSLSYYRSPDPVSYAEARGKAYQPIGEGDPWGRSWDSAWFRLAGEIPGSWLGKQVVAQLDFSGEGLVYGADGRILQGISNGSVFKHDFNRDLVLLDEDDRKGKTVELMVEATASGLFGVTTEPDPPPGSRNRYGSYDAKVQKARLCLFDPALWHLWLDLRIVNGLIKALPEAGVRRARLVRAAGEAIDAFADSPARAAKCRAVLSRELDRPASPSDLEVCAVGHAHIDTAWLWPVSETIRKCARTFASQVRLMERYPDYVFGASQPQQYAFVKEHYPELYAEIKRLVAQGRWEPQGGMWVEADCNIPGGESLVRQILYGKNFFREEFGVTVENLWLPDVFGYSPALPQILSRSGIPYFLTQKLSWNQVNPFPHHTFLWRGIDGSEVLAHFPPEDNYNSMLDPEALVAAQERFREKDFLGEFLSLFGVGDGGGGAKEENIELGLRQRDLEGAPRVRFGFARDFFRRLEPFRDRLPTWSGELYLELHRGTYTTQARVKKANRQLEHRLRSLEMLASCLPRGRYPAADLEALWKKVLLNQFHDILPGSSITRVYQDTRAEHEEALSRCGTLACEIGEQLFRREEGSLVLFNSLPWTYDRPLAIPAAEEDFVYSDGTGKPLAVQRENDSLILQAEIAPYSFLTLNKVRQAPALPVKKDALILENDLVRYEFDPQGALLRAWDKEQQREILASGAKGNLLALYSDHPNDWDAWDIDAFYQANLLGTAESVAAPALFSGPVRQTLDVKLKIGRSLIEQTIHLGQGTKRLDFETAIDWQEKHKMLRVGFRVDVRSDRAAFECAYGYVQRPTHRNTSWERSQFEVPVHRYLDLSDDAYGVALLNDCKYGARVEGDLLDLNLLRSPTYPDPDADQGRQEFVYSLLPHAGSLDHSGVLAEAAKLNQGVMVFEGWSAVGRSFPWRTEGDGLILAAVKKAEKEDCLILRVVENRGCHSQGRLVLADPKSRLVETDLIEWEHGKEILFGPSVPLALAPFEIKTFKLMT